MGFGQGVGGGHRFFDLFYFFGRKGGWVDWVELALLDEAQEAVSGSLARMIKAGSRLDGRGKERSRAVMMAAWLQG